jgi:hypothetical protein
MRVEQPRPAEEEETPAAEKSDLDKALEALLVGEVRVKIDPATGQVEKSPLTDHQDPNTIQ